MIRGVGIAVLGGVLAAGCAASAAAECRSACDRWRVLSCAEGEPTPGGAPCEDWCSMAEREGIDLAGPRACSERAESCDAVTACAGD